MSETAAFGAISAGVLVMVVAVGENWYALAMVVGVYLLAMAEKLYLPDGNGDADGPKQRQEARSSDPEGEDDF